MGPVWRAFSLSAVLVLGVAVFAQVALPESFPPPPADPRLTEPFGTAGDAVFGSLAKWDAAWYLAIAEHGYDARPPWGSEGETFAFFPLYPLLVRALGLGGGPEPQLVAAYVLSLACLLSALVLLRRLVALDDAPRVADATVLLIAVSPAAFYFAAPYTESLFLLLSVGAFYAARTGRWAWAGVLLGAASATKSVGLVVGLAVALLYLYGPRAGTPVTRAAPPRGLDLRPRFPIRRDALWLLLAPAGALAFTAFLEVAYGDPLRWLSAQEAWHRHLVAPFGGAVMGIELGAETLGDLWAGSGPGSLSTRVQPLVLVAFLVFGAIAAVGVLRELPAAYGVYVVVSLAIPLSTPRDDEPLISLPRFLLVLFPLFWWLARVAERRGALGPAAVVSGGLLVFFTTQFAVGAWFA